MWDGIAGSCWMPKQKTKTNTVCNIYYMDIFAREAYTTSTNTLQESKEM